MSVAENPRNRTIRENRENADHRNWFRMLLAMPFVPVPHVKDAFQFVKNTAPDIPRVRNFNDYFDSRTGSIQSKCGITLNMTALAPTITLNGIIHDSCGRQASYTPISLMWSNCSAKRKPHHSSPSSSYSRVSPLPSAGRSTSTSMLVWSNLDWNTCCVTGELSRISVPLDT